LGVFVSSLYIESYVPGAVFFLEFWPQFGYNDNSDESMASGAGLSFKEKNDEELL